MQPVSGVDSFVNTRNSMQTSRFVVLLLFIAYHAFQLKVILLNKTVDVCVSKETKHVSRCSDTRGPLDTIMASLFL